MPNQLDSIPSPAVDSVAEVFKPAAELTDTLTVHGVGHVRSLTTYSEMSHGSGHEPEPYGLGMSLMYLWAGWNPVLVAERTLKQNTEQAERRSRWV